MLANGSAYRTQHVKSTPSPEGLVVFQGLVGSVNRSCWVSSSRLAVTVSILIDEELILENLLQLTRRGAGQSLPAEKVSFTYVFVYSPSSPSRLGSAMNLLRRVFTELYCFHFVQGFLMYTLDNYLSNHFFPSRQRWQIYVLI